MDLREALRTLVQAIPEELQSEETLAASQTLLDLSSAASHAIRIERRHEMAEIVKDHVPFTTIEFDQEGELSLYGDLDPRSYFYFQDPADGTWYEVIVAPAHPLLAAELDRP